MATAETRPASRSTDRMPALYLSHGAPPLADDAVWPGQLAAWSADLPKPRAILIVSAHWEEAPLALGAVDPVPLVHDFWGFPEHYYAVRYDAPGAPQLAASVRALLRAPGVPVQDVPDRGLDHGAYVPLVEMYPDADVPVLQVSMPTLDPRRLMDLGRKLAPLRDEGVLIVGSGFFTHNLAALRHAGGVPGWSVEFDDWGHRALDAGDVDGLLDFTAKSPAGALAHPRTEHFAPLFVTMGAADAAGDLDVQHSVIDGFWMGLAKRSVQFG
ncbi:class III extradiol ring-cleavage dioxygenase [Streptomyces sp. NPDC049906]|uniref:dioxygenase family protein n=1 Tax=Streptomyces sp. NPDC049906 TaxID=3155656 RepID=UPI00341B485B